MQAHLFLGEALLEQESNLANSVAHLTKVCQIALALPNDPGLSP